MQALRNTASASGKRGVFDLDRMVAAHDALGEWGAAFTSLRARRAVEAMVGPNGRDG